MTKKRKQTWADEAVAVVLVGGISLIVVLAVIAVTRGLIIILGILIFRAWRRRVKDEELYELQTQIAQAQTLAGLLDQSPAEFEETVATILAKAILAQNGYEVAVVGGANDYGADIIARSQNGQLVIVQCKRYHLGRKVSSPEIQMFNGALRHYGASRAIFVTTASYTPSAIAYAEQNGIELVDGPRLLMWANVAAQAIGEAPHWGAGQSWAQPAPPTWS